MVETAQRQWSKRVTNPALIVVGSVLMIVAAFIFTQQELIGLAALGLVLAVSLLFTTVRVTVSTEGLRVAFGPWAWPAKRIGLERIERAYSERLSPLAYGGWGYRRGPDATTAVVVRAGDALVVDLDDGRRFAVTVDDASEAVDCIRQLQTFE